MNENLTMEELEGFSCSICLQEKVELYAVAKCSHSFCKQCAIGYISSQANNFAQAKCLQQGCGSALDKALPIYKSLDPSITLKLEFFQSYKFLQHNPDHSSCKTKDCAGLFKIKDSKCPLCQAKHCKKCLNLRHSGPCIESQEEREMKRLRYQKCPSCRVWVEKTEGCEYISCKCGISFCYRCGHEFSKDPCRKRQLWEKQFQIRNQMTSLPQLFRCSLKDIALLGPRLVIIALVLVPLTIFMCIVPPLILLLSFFTLVTLFLPFALCQPISQIEGGCCRAMAMILFLLTLPALNVMSALAFLLATLLYPCLRRTNHHGIYDGIDKKVAGMVSCYLGIVNSLFSCLDSC